MTHADAIQLVMAVLSLAALALALSTNRRLRKWSPWVGLCSQPAWLYYAYNARAWGLFTLAIAYTLTFAWHAWRQVRGGGH